LLGNRFLMIVITLSGHLTICAYRYGDSYLCLLYTEMSETHTIIPARIPQINQVANYQEFILKHK
jgi:hypothetical protein